MISAVDIRTVNRVLEGYSVLQHVRLMAAAKTAEITFTLDRGLTESGPKEYCRFCLSDLAGVGIWTEGESLPTRVEAEGRSKRRAY